MNRPVFISYARRASREAAVALHGALGGAAGLAFLDTTDIESGDHSPRALGQAILGARVVVVFAAEVYFQRWYCLRELRTALAPYDAARRRSESDPTERGDRVKHIVLALPAAIDPAGLEFLPPAVQQTSWPRESETAALARLVRDRLASLSRTVGDQLGSSEARAILETLLEESSIPPALRLTGPHWPVGSIAPSLGAGFLGRASELARLHLALSAPPQAGRPGAAAAVVLAATGGFGKTRLAVEYLHRFGPAYYPGGLFWIDGSQASGALESQWHGMLQTLRDVPDLPLMRSMGRSVKEELVRAVAEQPAERPVLVVFDNMPESDPGAPTQSFDCPVLGLAPLIITSRQQVSLPGGQCQTIDALPRDSAVLLLTREVPGWQEVARAEWERLAAWVGDLPLALELLNRSLALGGTTAGEILARVETASLTSELESQLEAFREQVPAGSLRGVASALELSYQKLKPEWKKVARLLAQLAAAPVPIALVSAFGPPLNEPPTRTALRARSLVTGGSQELYGTMHRIVADYLRLAAGNEEPEDWLTSARALAGLFNSRSPMDSASWALLGLLRPHAEHVVLEALSPRRLSQSAGEAEILRMAQNLGHFLHESGDHREALQYRYLLHEIFSNIEPAGPFTMQCAFWLARTYNVHGYLGDAERLLLGGFPPADRSGTGAV